MMITTRTMVVTSSGRVSLFLHLQLHPHFVPLFGVVMTGRSSGRLQGNRTAIINMYTIITIYTGRCK